MDLIIGHSRVPRKEWKWNENELGYEGVNTVEGFLKWFTYKNGLGGNTITIRQSYEDFIRDGPLKDSMPADIMLELYDDIMSAIND